MSVTERSGLHSVLDARSRSERTERLDLAIAAGDARASAAQVAVAEHQVAARRATWDAARAAHPIHHTPGVAASTATLADRYIARMRGELDAALDAHERTAAAHHGRLEALDTAHRRHARARAEHRVIERHFAAWRTARAKLADRRED